MIILILRPDKDNIGKNWRQISLLCSTAKTQEKLRLPKMLTHIPLHPAHHDYRPIHSTCTTLSAITADIAAGFSIKNPAPRIVLVALDLTAAFRQCGPSITARLCLQHPHTGNNSSLTLQLHAEQTSHSSFSAKRI